MPTLRNVTVHITTPTGQPLEEFGLQRLRNRPRVSCFIESRSDMPFRVSLQPTVPWPGFAAR